jgi:hypothetical protein
VTKSVRRRLTGLGYVVHTPQELYGSREASAGADDTDWLARVGPRNWVVISRDQKIHERQYEIIAYQEARIHMFLLPGQATAADLLLMVEENLQAICTASSGREPSIWKITPSGMRRYP